MRPIVGRMLFASALMFFGHWAQGAITCSVSSPGFSAYYVPADPTEVSQSSVTVSCTRGLLSDPASVNYSVAVNNGTTGSTPNRARRGGGGAANRINYDTYKNSGCTTLWTTGAGQITGTINFAGTGTMTSTQPWWACIASGQIGKNAGTFTDTVTMTLTAAGTTIVGGPFTFPVSIVHPASCTIAPVPGTIAFAYTSFKATPSVAGTTFGATCTNSMPYTIALDAYGGTLLGLNYTLVLNAGTLNMTGTGAVQTIPISGTIAAGQSGTCAAASCFASQGRTLTITY